MEADEKAPTQNLVTAPLYGAIITSSPLVPSRNPIYFTEFGWVRARCLHLLEKGKTLHHRCPLLFLKTFKTRQKAEKYVAEELALGQPPFPSTDVALYTFGSASH